MDKPIPTDPTKINFPRELADFLIVLEQVYASSNDSDKTAEIRQAREKMTEPNMYSAAIGEVYVFAISWQDAMKAKASLRVSDALLSPEEEKAMENYYGARAIFIKSCQVIFPVIAEIPMENIGPDLQEMESLLSVSCPAMPGLQLRLSEIRLSSRTSEFDKLLEHDPMLGIDVGDQISLAVSQSIREGLRNQAKDKFTIEFLAQLNVCILQMYRLELLRDALEKEMSRADSKTKNEKLDKPETL